MGTRYLFLSLCLTTSTLSLATPIPSPGTPIYQSTFNDAITGDNEFNFGGNKYWTVDSSPDADSYANDFYERPTDQTFSNVNGNIASAKYYGYLDIVRAQAGYDSEFLYISIEMFSLNESSGSSDSLKGLFERYGFRISNDPNGKSGYFFASKNPQGENGTTFGLKGNSGHFDTNDDVSGSGITVVNENPGSMNGYETVVAQDGEVKDGPFGGEPVLWSRISPTNNKVVEFALRLEPFGIKPADLQYLQFEANKGLLDTANYLWNDKYSFAQAGNPYQVGSQNIYQLDTLQGEGFRDVGAVPEPSTYLLVGAGLAAVAIRRRRARS